MTQQQPAQPDADCPLYVDLDGTLIAGDLLWESLLAIARTQPLLLLMTPIWALMGRHVLKQQLARRVQIDPDELPYRPGILEWLREQKQAGRRIVLATASEQSLVEPIAAHLDLFDHVLATHASTNLKGHAKLQAIRQDAGGQPFDYLGDSSADLPILQAARRPYLVAPSSRLTRRLVSDAKPETLEPHPGGKLFQLFFAMRPRQWAKNLLLFVPLLLAHQVRNLDHWLTLLAAFLAFSLTASAVYLINDLLDMPADRRHARKRNRPFASGRLTVGTGVIAAPILLLLAFALAAFATPPLFLALLAVYFALTSAYSLYIKRKLVIDVIVLAGLYTLRLIAGGAAVDIPLTPWLLAFSMFLFVSLAFAKRYTELLALQQNNLTAAHGRGYQVDDLAIIRSVGPASGYLAVMIFGLYINSETMWRLYHTPEFLWFIVPVFLYWITRVWFLANRGRLHDDPVVFALTDPISYLAGLITAALLIAAKFYW